MAKAKENGKSVSTTATPVQRADFVGYINISLTEADKSDYDVWASENDIISEDYLASLELGYQYTLKHSATSASFTCSVSCWDKQRPDAGLIYTAHSSSPDTALLKAIYVVARKFALNLGNGYVKRRDPDAF